MRLYVLNVDLGYDGDSRMQNKLLQSKTSIATTGALTGPTVSAKVLFLSYLRNPILTNIMNASMLMAKFSGAADPRRSSIVDANKSTF
jgi:hypothetical protein